MLTIKVLLFSLFQFKKIYLNEYWHYQDYVPEYSRVNARSVKSVRPLDATTQCRCFSSNPAETYEKHCTQCLPKLFPRIEVKQHLQ